GVSDGAGLVVEGVTVRVGSGPGAATLLEGVGFSAAPGTFTALLGPNGAGKSTLLRAVAAVEAPDSGSVRFDGEDLFALSRRERARRVALVEQEAATEVALSGRAVAALGRTPYESMFGGRDAEADAVVARALEVAGAGAFAERDVTTLSGGERQRVHLARALAQQPRLLLLDEPTNHLDIESLEWLEGYLQGLDAAVVLVAHDRWFLESVGTSVLELEAGRGRFFAGPWHAWRAEQAARELAAGRDAARREAEIARMVRFVERFRYKATKARQAQSKLKSIERLRRDAPEVDPRDGRALAFSFGDAQRSGRVVLELTDGRIEAGDRILLDGAELWLERGEHVCLVGPNGAGKTTLVETLAGRRQLAAGKLSRGHNVSLGYLAQHTELAEADADTVLRHAQRATGLSEARTRALLGRFLFSGEEVERRLGELSGGEARRLSLALLTSSDANLLVLDEPTNHLDLESREALEDALTAFAGTVLLISHDRALLEAVGSRTVVVEDGGLSSHPGGWAEYRSRREAERSPAQAKRPAPRRPKSSGPSKNRQALIERRESEVEAAQAALDALESELADPSHWATPQRSAASTRRHEEARAAVDRAYAAWEEASEGA
ncbi:MAG: ABC-F family ATP-binding cassette domain-containing protein, partial [Solirubrobacterales bacterium]